MRNATCSEQEDDVNQKLGKILQEESKRTHKFAIVDWFVQNVFIVVDAKRVKDCCEEHILPNEAHLAVALHVRQRVAESLIHFVEGAESEDRVDQSSQDEESDGSHKVPLSALKEEA